MHFPLFINYGRERKLFDETARLVCGRRLARAFLPATNKASVKKAPGGRMAKRKPPSTNSSPGEASPPNNMSSLDRIEPCPISSRKVPMAISNNANPEPMDIPSIKLAPTLLREANISARATIVQLVTIKGINIPHDLPSDRNQASTIISMQVTKLAMMNTYIGIRMSARMNRRVADTKTFEKVKTSKVARPSPKPFTNVVVTASNGQRPNN